MAEIRYGLVEGDGKGREVRVAASQKFYRLGGKFAKLVNGYATLCASDAATIHGWLNTPKDATASNTYWTSSSTAGEDKVFMIYPDDQNAFDIPNKATTCTASDIGAGAKIIIASGVQKAQRVDTAASSCLSIIDVDTVNNILKVKVIPANRVIL